MKMMYAVSSIRSTEHISLLIDIYNIKLLFNSDNLKDCSDFISKKVNICNSGNIIDSIIESVNSKGYYKIYDVKYLYIIVDLNFQVINDPLIKESVNKIKSIIREKSIDKMFKSL